MQRNEVEAREQERGYLQGSKFVSMGPEFFTILIYRPPLPQSGQEVTGVFHSIGEKEKLKAGSARHLFLANDIGLLKPRVSMCTHTRICLHCQGQDGGD
jgi:hypothetical protein